jgi:diacylglycerol O-acyltransferase
VLISNVPGPAMPLYMAGARMTHYHPVSIPYHGMALNITVQSYAGSLDFGLTACRRVLSQEESYELVGYLRDALDEIRQLPTVEPAADDTSKHDAATQAPVAAAAAAAKKTAKRQAKPPSNNKSREARVH